MPETAEIQPFVFPATGQKVRTAVVDGEPLVCHVDVCTLLQHSNPSVAIRLVDDEDKLLIDTRETDNDALKRPIPGNARTWFLTEAGFYTLALTSEAPGAKQLRRWITREVLPAIRKTGGYAAGGAVPAPVSISVTLTNALAELAHDEHVVPAAARILAFKRWRKPRKGMETAVQLALDIRWPGIDGGGVDVRALPPKDGPR